jgi:hypothetical protein
MVRGGPGDGTSYDGVELKIKFSEMSQNHKGGLNRRASAQGCFGRETIRHGKMYVIHINHVASH